jgi:hypothetical protein
MKTYGQKFYSEKIGGGNGGGEARYTIAQIGCFLTSFCNLLARYGEPIAPPDLNALFIKRHVFSDMDDGVKDDLGYGAVSAKDPSVVIAGRGKGWPKSNDAIVKFRYQSVSHPWLFINEQGKQRKIANIMTHFSLVADAKRHMIIDSWDGATKKVEQTPYGQPIEWVAYSKAAPQRLHPVVEPKSEPAAAPKKPEPVHVTVSTAPTDATTYVIHSAVTGYYTSNDASNHLTTHPQGTVKPGAYHIFNQANGMINVTTVPGQPGSWINPADNKRPEPTPAAPAKVIEYSRLEKPLELVTNKQPTLVWDLLTAAQSGELAEGAPFVAFGKAQRSDGDRPCYYMSAESFGEADTTGAPAHTQGINTVDLSLPPASVPAPTLKIVDNSGMPEETPAAPAEPAAPTAPDLPAGVTEYQRFMNPVAYVVKADLLVKDLTGSQPDIKRAGGSGVLIGAKFNYNGYLHFRAQSSIDHGTWYVFPATSVRLRKEGDPVGDPDADLDTISGEALQLAVSEGVTHPTAIRRVATAEGWIERILTLLRLRK